MPYIVFEGLSASASSTKAKDAIQSPPMTTTLTPGGSSESTTEAETKVVRVLGEKRLPLTPKSTPTPHSSLGPLRESTPHATSPRTPLSAKATSIPISTVSVREGDVGYPVVKLDTEEIRDVVAARLAGSLLGHVLFLKNQVPLPVLQLMRIPAGKGTPRAAKLRTELLNSFDTISSHLDTTFSALSVAFARLASNVPSTSSTITKPASVMTTSSANSRENATDPRPILPPATSSPKKQTKAYMAILVGPSMGTAKAKVIFGVDGLQIPLWQERMDRRSEARDEKDNDEEDAEVEEEPESDDAEDVEEEDEDEEDASGESDAEVPEDSEDEDTGEEREEGENRSQSLSCSSSTLSRDARRQSQSTSTPVSAPVRSRNPLSSISCSPPPPTRQRQHSHQPFKPSNPTRHQSEPPSDYVSHAEEKKFIQNAERLLARTLATADADGAGLASEIAPTQTYVLIRAPRTFEHPAWIPRQNLTLSLDGVLGEFLRESGLGGRSSQGDSESSESKPRLTKNKKKGGVVVEGVWLTSKHGLSVDEIVNAGDEDMVWWSWDGKLAGFSDW